MRLPILVLHISAGTLGILSGFVAIFLRKGSNNHRKAGNVFVVSMLIMATAGTGLAFMKHQAGNVVGGMVTNYMVATAWLTARRGDKHWQPGIFDWAGLLVALVSCTVILTTGMEKVFSQTAPTDGVPAGMNFFMGTVILLAVTGDFRMLLRGGLSGVQRFTRHLWRMCFGLFIATGSFFLGQGNKVFPSYITQSNVLFIPALLPLILLIFWLVRVRFTNAHKKMSIPRGGDVYSLRT